MESVLLVTLVIVAIIEGIAINIIVKSYRKVSRYSKYLEEIIKFKDNEVTKLKILEANYKSNIYKLEDKVLKTYPEEIKRT
ncbi:MAG: hypothetical protein ACI33I_12305, partial [Clostridium sp.]